MKQPQTYDIVKWDECHGFLLFDGTYDLNLVSPHSFLCEVFWDVCCLCMYVSACSCSFGGASRSMSPGLVINADDPN